MDKNMEISHLGREVKTALELAIAALAPADLVDRLALAAGFLDAIVQFPSDSAPSLALLPGRMERTRQTLDDWHKWRKDHLPKASA